MLACELTRASGDPTAAFAAYERTMMPSVLGSRKLAGVNAKTIVAGSRLSAMGLIAVGRLISIVPLSVTQSIARLNNRGVRLYDTMPLPEYTPRLRSGLRFTQFHSPGCSLGARCD